MKQLIVLAVAVILGLFFYVFGISNNVQNQAQRNIATYSNPEIGLEFNYFVGPSGYVVEESNVVNTVSGLVRTIVLIRSEDVNRNIPVGGEGPATIALQVFKNTEKQTPLAWAEKHIQFSNINLKIGNVVEVVVGGAPAIRYMADGLYASDNVVVVNGDYVYLMSGMFIDAESQLRKDFSPLVESVHFVPVQGTDVQGKLNINAICEGALAYMKFPDGSRADAFVAECKEGKHPEVIEQYKLQMGLGDGASL